MGSGRAGDRAAVERSGGRIRAVAYARAAYDGTLPMLTGGTFNGSSLQYFEPVRRKWGRAALITDNAPQQIEGAQVSGA